MSSSAPRQKLAISPSTPSSPFCYPEAQLPLGPRSSAILSEQANESHIRQREAEAFERGRQAVEEQLRTSSEAALAHAREQISSAIAQFARERGAYYQRVEAEVVQLAIAIARKILHRETQLDPYVLAGIVRVTLEKLDAGTGIHLYVPPADATDWRHYFANQSEGSVTPEVHEDSTLPLGECRIESSLGTTEVGIESQLKEIETGLLDLLAECPVTREVNPSHSKGTKAVS
jgi:flagellar assembly protein FliH